MALPINDLQHFALYLGLDEMLYAFVFAAKRIKRGSLSFCPLLYKKKTLAFKNNSFIRLWRLLRIF